MSNFPSKIVNSMKVPGGGSIDIHEVNVKGLGLRYIGNVKGHKGWSWVYAGKGYSSPENAAFDFSPLVVKLAVLNPDATFSKGPLLANDIDLIIQALDSKDYVNINFSNGDNVKLKVAEIIMAMRKKYGGSFK